MSDTDQKPHAKLLEAIVAALVDHAEDVKIEQTNDEQGVLLTLGLHPDDMGKVIGRGGDTARSIRTILRAYGMRVGARISLKIPEPEGSSYRAPAAAAEPDPLESIRGI